MSGSLSRLIERVQTGRADVTPRRPSLYETDEAAPTAAEPEAGVAPPPVAPRSSTEPTEPPRRPAVRAEAPSEPRPSAAERPEPAALAQAIVVRELQRITEATERRVEIHARTATGPSAAPTEGNAPGAAVPAEPQAPPPPASPLPARTAEGGERQAAPARLGEDREPAAEPSISLEIGRIEIISPPRPAPASAPRRRGPRLDLDAYLAARRRGER